MREAQELRRIRDLMIKSLAFALGCPPDRIDSPMTQAVKFRKQHDRALQSLCDLVGLAEMRGGQLHEYGAAVAEARAAIDSLMPRQDLNPYCSEDQSNRGTQNSVALWMIQHGYVTGHGDTVADLLGELEIQAGEAALKNARPALASAESQPAQETP